MKTKILFVCLGNICRSPAAEGVMAAKVKQAGLGDTVILDSAGTDAFHAGEPADRRMRAAATERGYELTSISRRITHDDLGFDYIITMDADNYENVHRKLAANGTADNLYRMTEFCSRHPADYVPDPYYGGPGGFENVLDILEDACDGLLAKVQTDAG